MYKPPNFPTHLTYGTTNSKNVGSQAITEFVKQTKENSNSKRLGTLVRIAGNKLKAYIEISTGTVIGKYL